LETLEVETEACMSNELASRAATGRIGFSALIADLDVIMIRTSCVNHGEVPTVTVAFPPAPSVRISVTPRRRKSRINRWD
jgi:hypothetical protein